MGAIIGRGVCFGFLRFSGRFKAGCGWVQGLLALSGTVWEVEQKAVWGLGLVGQDTMR